MKRVYINITAYVMAVIIIITSILSLPLSVSAQTTATDDNGNNIIKVLDMALNKSGISASPTTIQDFLDYMYDTVIAAGQDLSSTFESAYDKLKDPVSACKENVASSELIPDSAKSLINGYVDFVGKCLDVPTNFKTFYDKGENFRNYLMSYVTDMEDNSLTGAINKNNKYNINGELVNLVRQNMDAYIEEHEGYYLVPTFTYKNLSYDLFSTREQFLFWYDTMQTLGDNDIFHFSLNNSRLMRLTNTNLVGNIDKWAVTSASGTYYYPYFNKVNCYSDDWVSVRPLYVNIRSYDTVPDLSDTSIYSTSSAYNFNSLFMDVSHSSGINTLFTKDGRLIKVWKSLEAFKSYTVGKSNIYYSSAYSTFDNSVDNSITFSGGYYSNNDYSHTTIQNNIDNSQEINETTINNIVNNYITNNYYGSYDGSGGGSETGNWFTDLITGIPQLLSALLDGITGLLEAGGKLLEAVTELFTKLFVPSEGFADPIKEKIEEKFIFIDDTHASMLDIVDRFSEMGQTAPTITFPLSETPLAEYGVGDITVSFEWFEPYRLGFQLLLSAIMWAMFLFNQFFGLKNLIQGTGSFTSTIEAEEPEHNPIGFLW